MEFRIKTVHHTPKLVVRKGFERNFYCSIFFAEKLYSRYPKKSMYEHVRLLFQMDTFDEMTSNPDCDTDYSIYHIHLK